MPLFFHKFLLILSFCLLLPACSSFSTEKKGEFEGWTVDQFVSASKEAVEDEKYKKAIKILEQLDSRYPFGDHSSQAQLDLSYAYYKNNDTEAATASAQRFIKTHPRHENIDYAYYLKGLVNFNHNLGFIDRYIPSDATQRDTVFIKSSYLNFQELVRRYPDSKYAADAKQRMIYLDNALARHELHVARFYMDREAFLAAINRVNYILEYHKTAPVIPYALELQIKAYKILDLADLAANTQKIYDYNYPNGPILPEEAPSSVVVVPFIWDVLGFDD
ncbi:MAG: outer membrane protein assembly factor BamD [Methyloprofundus sp.]|nr:outer membrane protein assembly factor BamD [Methyloprofundus sp.]